MKKISYQLPILEKGSILQKPPLQAHVGTRKRNRGRPKGSKNKLKLANGPETNQSLGGTPKRTAQR
jgi:hypothetical protein